MTLGFIPSLIGAVIMALFRVFLGGVGVLAGIINIFVSFAIGSIWRKFRFKKVSAKMGPLGLELLLVGFLVHLGVYLTMYFLPQSLQTIVLHTMVVPILIYYPLGFYLLCLLLFNQARREATVSELQRSEHQLKTIFEQAPIGMALTDLITGEIQKVNQSYLDILGLEREELVGRTWSEFTHPEDKALSAKMTEKDCIKRSFHDVMSAISFLILRFPMKF